MTRARWAWWGACSAIGALLIALPDADNRVVSFSRNHGPSPLDALGIVVLLAGWMVLERAVWRHRRDLVARTRRAIPGTFAAGFGAGLVVASALSDFPHWWAVGAVALGGVQVAAVLSMAGRGRQSEGESERAGPVRGSAPAPTASLP